MAPSNVELLFQNRKSIDKVDFILEAATQLLHFYEQYFGINYPLNKLDLSVVHATNDVAIESLGLIWTRPSELLYKKDANTEVAKIMAVKRIAHGLVHQFDKSALIGMEEALKADSLERTTSLKLINQNIDPSNLQKLYDAFPYDKSLSIIGMLETIMGPSLFENGLKNFLQYYQFNNFIRNAVWEFFSLQKKGIYPSKIKDIMDGWISQEGFPLVTIRKNGRDLTTTWIIPFKLVTNKYPIDYITIRFGTKNHHLKLKEDYDLLYVHMKGHVRLKVALNFLSYMKAEEHVNPWLVVLQNLKNIIVQFSTNSDYPKLKRETNQEIIVFRYGVRYGGQEVWNHVMSSVASTNSPSNKRNIMLTALTYTNDTTKVYK
ncbi:hypothetical protein HELRODRAFT_177630 [Helobdella robusta]|uniref:Peptidase M1 membrane alanine aminopeptidase domain-containing protein n=1 Tax=Helobdella robusta TaxID=6412 RepID=T1FBY8_HELRO|nr:hypothetical protein HELRODRAFT_177630 [Helobdella robusta]ESN97959.1 hypothetical protein HELRODRAFT_177630 [Helobdella robusta]